MEENLEIKTLVCSKCGKELPVTDFYTRKNSKTGYSNVCKSCHQDNCKESREKRKRLLDIEKNGGKKLSQYTPRELMEELARRGYRGKLQYVQEIDITDF